MIEDKKKDFEIKYDASQPNNVCMYDTTTGLAVCGFDSLDEAKAHKDDFIEVLVNWRF